MPIEYEIDARLGRIQTRCIGDATLGEVIDHFRTLQADEHVPAEPDVLLDFSDLTSFPDSGQVRSIAAEVRSLAPHLAWRHCAVVAPRDLAFAIGRMFEMLSEPSFRATMVFRRRVDAEAWLDARSGEPRAR